MAQHAEALGALIQRGHQHEAPVAADIVAFTKDLHAALPEITAGTLCYSAGFDLLSRLRAEFTRAK